MTSHTQTNAAGNAGGMRGEIAAKWSKIGAAEIAALKTTADLITQVENKYTLPHAKAEADVGAFARGRHL